MSEMTVSEVHRELARLVGLLRRLLPGDQFASDVERLVKYETIEAAVARERARCARLALDHAAGEESLIGSYFVQLAQEIESGR